MNLPQNKITQKLYISIGLILLANLFLGVSHIAILPPWEGFDEIAHYSSIQQIADTKTVPRQSEARISQDVELYYSFGPMPYSTNPPMEKNRGLTYRRFFQQNVSSLASAKQKIAESPNRPRQFRPGAELNWQSQHPPLFYALLTPVYHLTKDLSWHVHLFSLRLVSYLFVWSAFIVGLFAVERTFKATDSGDSAWQKIGIVTWPLLFVSWFPSMARLGNDSLCALLLAVLWLIVCGTNEKCLSTRETIVIGVVLGLGCLTKAFFVPISVGTVLFLLFRNYKQTNTVLSAQLVRHLITIIAITGVISGWWYIRNWIDYGVLLGSIEMIQLEDGLESEVGSQFSIWQWIRGHIVFVRTFGWVGTWSWARPENSWLVLVSLLPLLIAWFGISSLRKYPNISSMWMPIWWFVPVIGGFSYHIFVRVSTDGIGTGTSGYFLNILVVPLGVIVGLALQAVWRTCWLRLVVMALGFYSLVLAVYTTWLQTTLFAGISRKSGDSPIYEFDETYPLGWVIQQAYSRLQLLANPDLTISFWLTGAVLAVIGLGLLVRSISTDQ